MASAQDQTGSLSAALASRTAPELLAQCYHDIRRIARRMVAGDSQRVNVQATELAHEAMLRLIGLDRMRIHGQSHMLALAAQSMRRVLIDESRKNAAGKRQPPAKVTVWPNDPTDGLIELSELDRALVALRAISTEHAEIVELRFMLGLTVEEVSAATGTPSRTVKRHWHAARAWLFDHLTGDGADRL